MSYNNKEYWQNRWKNNVYKDEFKTHTKEIDNIFNNKVDFYDKKGEKLYFKGNRTKNLK